MNFNEFINWYDSLPKDAQYDIDAIADEEGIPFYDEASEEDLAYLKDMYEAKYIIEIDNKLQQYVDDIEFGADLIYDIAETLGCSEKSAQTIYQWYKDEYAFDDFDNKHEFLDFMKSDIYDMLDACDDLDERDEILQEITSATYGGAYDIDADQYFTKEELVEFGDNLAEEISNKYGENWLLDSIYLIPEENNHLEIEITNNDIQLKSDLHIDMRRIRQPLDIYKYSKMIIDQLSEGHEEYFEEITSSSKIGASTMYKCIDMGDPVVKQYNDFDSWLEDTVDSGYIRRIYSSKSIKCSDEEDVEYLDNQDTLREFINELVANGVDIYDDQDILQELGANYGYDRDDQFAILEDIREYVGQGINSSEEIDEDDISEVDQEFTSKDTSINNSKLPAIYKLVNFPKGATVLDYGCGRYDNGLDYLRSLGCNAYGYDPYNRPQDHNREVIRNIRSNGGADITLCSNVLNVIKEQSARINVLNNIKKLTRPDGKIYITVYEGTGTGQGKRSQDDAYQLNKKTKDYMDEIHEVFPDAKRKGKLIIVQ